MPDDEFDLIVDLFTAMLNKALENRARNKGAIDEYYAARREGRQPDLKSARKKNKPRKVSQYAKTYAKKFKKVQSKYKKKNGSWKKDGFKRAQKEAHKLTKKELKK